MNLQLQLFFRILLVALVCLIASAWYLLNQSNQQAINEAEKTASRIESQMKQQLIQMFQRYEMSRSFPDANLWGGIDTVPGSCVQFLSRTQSRQRSLCNAGENSDKDYPEWFGHFYNQFFDPAVEIKRSVSFNAMKYGTVLVTLNRQIETARVWHTLQAMLKLLIVTISSLCLLVFITINRMLRPASTIVSGLEKMRSGDLVTRLPDFDIAEWRKTSQAINALADTQQQTLADNSRLSLKLINIQEEERRYISRELHDEFGQCLAGINAVTTSLSQTAKEDSPALIDDIARIRRITTHMMDSLRSMLTHLRPIEVDELGLTLSLEQLIKGWQQRGTSPKYHLHIEANLDELAPPMTLHIYRIVQECLTNIAKHAQAKHAEISLTQTQHNQIEVLIKDDGNANVQNFSIGNGLGLLGIHERVAALGGQISLDNKPEGGLIVSILLPIDTEEEMK